MKKEREKPEKNSSNLEKNGLSRNNNREGREKNHRGAQRGVEEGEESSNPLASGDKTLRAVLHVGSGEAKDYSSGEGSNVLIDILVSQGRGEQKGGH